MRLQILWQTASVVTVSITRSGDGLLPHEEGHNLAAYSTCYHPQENKAVATPEETRRQGFKRRRGRVRPVGFAEHPVLRG
jgi:hypothetical protein